MIEEAIRKSQQAEEWNAIIQELPPIKAAEEVKKLAFLAISIIHILEKKSNLLSREFAFVEFYSYLEMAINNLSSDDKFSERLFNGCRNYKINPYEVIILGAMIVSQKHINELTVCNIDFISYLKKRSLADLNRIENLFLKMVNYAAPNSLTLTDNFIKYRPSNLSKLTSKDKGSFFANTKDDSFLFKNSIKHQKNKSKSRLTRSFSFNKQQAN